MLQYRKRGCCLGEGVRVSGVSESESGMPTDFSTVRPPIDGRVSNNRKLRKRAGIRWRSLLSYADQGQERIFRDRCCLSLVGLLPLAVVTREIEREKSRGRLQIATLYIHTQVNLLESPFGLFNNVSLYLRTLSARKHTSY